MFHVSVVLFIYLFPFGKRFLSITWNVFCPRFVGKKKKKMFFLKTLQMQTGDASLLQPSLRGRLQLTCCWLALMWGKSLCPSVTGLLLVVPLWYLYMCSEAVNWGLDHYSVYGGGQLIWTSNLERSVGSSVMLGAGIAHTPAQSEDHLGKLKGEKGTCCSYCWEVLLKSAFLRGGDPPFPCPVLGRGHLESLQLKNCLLFSKTKTCTKPRSCRAYQQ